MQSNLPVILIVDDDELRDAMCVTLCFHKIEVIGYKQAEPVISILEGGKQAIIVTDWQLPGMSGLQFLDKALKIDPEIQIIVIASYAIADVTIFSEGAKDLLIKPFEPESLLEAIEICQPFLLNSSKTHINKNVTHKKQSQKFLEEIEKYTPLVKRIAYELDSKLHSNVEVEHLIQAGFIGLRYTLKLHARQTNLSFEISARTNIKVAIYYFCYKKNILPNGQGYTLTRLEEINLTLFREFERPPSDKEITLEANLSLNAYFDIIDNIANFKPINDDHINYPSKEQKVKNQFAVELAKALEKLPEKEQIVMALHYQEDLSYREIAELLNLTTGRISQLHTQGMILIRSHLKL